MKHPLGAALRNGRVASLLIVLLAQRVAGLDCDPGSFAATPTECAGCTAGTMALGFGNTACVDIPNDLEAAIVANALAQCKIACDVTYTTDTYMCDLYTFVSSGGFHCTCSGFTLTSPAHPETKAMKCKAFCDDVKGMAVASTTPAELARVEADYRGDAPSGLACSDCVQCNGILVQLSGPSTMCGGCRPLPRYTPLYVVRSANLSVPSPSTMSSGRCALRGNEQHTKPTTCSSTRPSRARCAKRGRPRECVVSKGAVQIVRQVESRRLQRARLFVVLTSASQARRGSSTQ